MDDEACPLEWSDLSLQLGTNKRSISAGRIPAGSSLAVTGNDLISKSLFTESLAGLVTPTSGIVTVAEMDAQEAAVAGKGRLVAVANRVEVFNASIGENVELGRAGVGEDRIREVLKAVGLWNIVHQLPNGVSTLLKTGGYPFSEDQVARLMLARAIAARPQIGSHRRTLGCFAAGRASPKFGPRCGRSVPRARSSCQRMTRALLRHATGLSKSKDNRRRS